MFDNVELSVNDLRASQDKSGGFVSVKLYDADDHDTFILGEDEILALKNYLIEVIKQHNLEGPFK